MGLEVADSVRRGRPGSLPLRDRVPPVADRRAHGILRRLAPLFRVSMPAVWFGVGNMRGTARVLIVARTGTAGGTDPVQPPFDRDASAGV
ncbi:hypothetical protein [Streptomyces sp. NPDC006333]|uniref:hypothetical protein n=1 Tax=Streptomyces sp. NPDC006333 TaxID=3156753 RepID=UPI0033ABE382